MIFKKFSTSDNQWHDASCYIRKTATDNITSLPTTIYSDGTNASLAIKGNTVQNGTPSPSNPVSVDGVGELETSGEHAGDYKIPILNNLQTTNVYLSEVGTTRQIKKLVLDGTEEWTYITGGKHWTPVTGYQKSGLMCICSHYEAVENGSGSGTIANGQVCFYSTTNDRLIFRDTDYSTTENWKSYLAQQYANSTPVTVWYVLTTPETGIVNEPLMRIGDYADSISASILTTDGANTLDVPTALPPSSVDVNYHGWHNADVHERANGAWT